MSSDVPSQYAIRSTTSHLYRDQLGTGSSCDVYKGVHMKTNKIRALKITKDLSWKREIDKEASALRKLKRHPNIIEFYGQEIDELTKHPCLIIEFCSGGSLHSYLKEVENRRGLPDAEFLVLLDHITLGLEHIRQYNCIHRDIKPGNILRHVTPEGRSVYKLSDFGASRLMKFDSEEFVSLAGTEEYLHPAMYEKAFVNRKSTAMFNSCVDMWSLGCTLYQAITGEMPFIPFDGARKNRSTMYQMITCKPSGAISGSQFSLDSEIEWHQSFPENSNVTRSLQRHILPVLVGLLEADSSKQWEFSTYKHNVNQILRLKKIIVIYCEENILYNLYLNTHLSFAEFQDVLAAETELSADNQKLYYHQLRLIHFLKEGSKVENFPPTAVTSIVLISQLVEARVGLKLTLEPYPSFLSSSTVADDLDVAFSQCETIYTIYKKMLETRAVINGLYSACLTMWSNLQHKHYRLEKKYQAWFESFKQIRWCFDEIKKVSDENMRNGIQSQFEKLLSFQPIAEFYTRLKGMKADIMKSGYSKLWVEPQSELDNDWCKLTATLLDRAKLVLSRIQARKKTKTNEYEQANHHADRIEMQELTARCVYLWQSPCTDEIKKAGLGYSRRKQMYMNKNMEMLESEESLLNLEECCQKCQKKYSEIVMFLINKRFTVHLAERLSPIGAVEYSINQPHTRSLSRSLTVVNEMKTHSLKLNECLKQLPVVIELEQSIDKDNGNSNAQHKPCKRFVSKISPTSGSDSGYVTNIDACVESNNGTEHNMSCSYKHDMI